MSLIRFLKFRTWERQLLKMPRFETPRFQTRTRVTVTSGLYTAANENAWTLDLFYCKLEISKKVLQGNGLKIQGEHIVKVWVKNINEIQKFHIVFVMITMAGFVNFRLKTP